MPSTRQELESKIHAIEKRQTTLIERQRQIASELEAARGERLRLLTAADGASTTAITDRIVRLESEAHALTPALAAIDGELAPLYQALRGVTADESAARHTAALTAAKDSQKPLTAALRTFAVDTIPPLIAQVQTAVAALGVAAKAADAAESQAGRPVVGSRLAQVPLIEQSPSVGLMRAGHALLEAAAAYRLASETAVQAERAAAQERAAAVPAGAAR